MASLLGNEREIVHDALLLFKGLITKKHLTDVSNLPRNGKSASTLADDQEEQFVISRLKDIDKILDQYAKSDEKKKNIERAVPLETYQPNVPAKFSNMDEEPYVNPFTGLMVYPDTPNAPGPSAGSKQSIHILKSATARNENVPHDQAYQNALRITSAQNHILDSPLRHAALTSAPVESFESSSQTQHWDNLSAKVDTPSTDGTSSDRRSEHLENSLQSFLNDYEGRKLCNSTDSTNDSPRSFAILSPARAHEDPTRPPNLDMHGMAKRSGPRQSSRDPTISGLKLLSRNPYMPVVSTRTASGSEDTDTCLLETPAGGEIVLSVGQDLNSVREEGDTSNVWSTQVEADRATILLLEQEEEQRYKQLKMDAKLAHDLNDTSQSPKSSFEEQQDHDLQVQIELEMIQRQLHKQDQQEMELTMTQLQAAQDEWNQTWVESMQQQQSWAQQIVEQEQQKETADTMREMRHWQETFHSAESRQIEADRLLALSLAEENYDEQVSGPFPASFTDFDTSYPSHEFGTETSTEQPPSAVNNRTLATTATTATSTRDSDYSQANTSESFRQAQQLHQQWQSEWRAEIDKNAEAARAVQKEIEDLESQARVDMDRLRQEHERQRQEEERQRQEAERRRAEEERQRKARMCECNVCGDEADRDAMFRFPCKHAYCRECLNASIDDAFQSRKVFHCCRNRADPSMISQFLSTEKVDRYAGLVEELETPNPVYCSRRKCSAFVPPRHIQADTATCGKCGTRTCTKCKGESHAGVCAQDHEGQAVLALGQAQRWKTCPHCKQLVERASGCLHMTCRCGQSFCYSCGKSSSRCQGTCER